MQIKIKRIISVSTFHNKVFYLIRCNGKNDVVFFKKPMQDFLRILLIMSETNGVYSRCELHEANLGAFY